MPTPTSMTLFALWLAAMFVAVAAIVAHLAGGEAAFTLY